MTDIVSPEIESESSMTSYDPFHSSPSLFQPNASEEVMTTGNQSTTRMRDEELAKIEMGVLSAIFILTVLGNLIVILGIYFRRQKMSRMYYFILHLSIADLITAFFNVGSQFVMELTFPEFIGNNLLCKFVKYTQILGPYSSSYVLVMTAIDRYQAICFPLSNCTWTAKQSKLMLAIAWLISCLFSVPQLFIFSLQDVMGHPDCWASFPSAAQEVYVTWYAISFFIVPLLILIFTYTCICKTIWTNFNMKTAATKQDYGGSVKGRGPAELETHIGNEDDSVFPTTDQLNEFTAVNNRDMSKQLEVSWRIDKKGNVSTVSGQPTGVESHGDNLTRQRIPGDEVEDDGGSDQSHDIRILQNGPNGSPAVEFHNHSSSNLQKSENNAKNGGDGKKMSSHLMLPSKKYMTTAVVSNINVSKNYLNGDRAKFPARQRLLTNDSSTQPRTSSIKGISRAKIKTVKLTVTVICCYIFCSSPFITAQLWVTFDPNAYQSKFYTGTTFTILTLLASLNSCVNPWIFLFFNPNLLQDFLRGIGCKVKWPMGKLRQQPSGGSPETQKTSPGQFQNNGSSFNSTRGRHYVNQISSARILTPSIGSSVSSIPQTRRPFSSSINFQRGSGFPLPNSLPSPLLH